MNWKKPVVFIASVMVCIVPLLLTFNRGINYFDEGYIIEGARRIMDGEVPYRDFHFVYTSGSIHFVAFFFQLFGQRVIVERMAAMLLSIVGVIFLGLIVKKQTKNNLLTLLAMALYSVWGPTHINFLWPVMCVLPLVYAYLYFFVGSNYYLAGGVMGLVLLFKHNFGGALIISFMLFFWLKGMGRRQIFKMAIGFMCIIAPFFITLFISGALYPFLRDMKTYTIQEILIRKSFSVPFPTQSLGKMILYMLPGILPLIIGVWLFMMHKKDKLIIIPLTFFFLYLFGIYPTPDWPHLTPLLSTIGTYSLFLPLMRNDKMRILGISFLALFLGAGIYSASMRNYYRWEAPYPKQIYCITSGRMKGICLDEKNYAVISQTISPIVSLTSRRDYIFAFYNNPIYYFITDTDNPTPYIDFNVSIGKKEELMVLNYLLKKKVKIVISRFPLRNNQSTMIGNYIEKYYSPTHSVYEFTIWKYVEAVDP